MITEEFLFEHSFRKIDEENYLLETNNCYISITIGKEFDIFILNEHTNSTIRYTKETNITIDEYTQLLKIVNLY